MSKSEGPESIEHWEAYLAIDRNDLDRCLTQQPEVMYHVAQGVAQASADRDALKLSIEETKAQLDQDIRAKALREEEKLTETGLQNRLKTLPKVQELERDFLEARRVAENWQVLKEAFQQRSFMLRELVALFIAQRHDLNMEAGAGQSRAALRDNQAEANRAAAGAIRRQRRTINE